MESADKRKIIIIVSSVAFLLLGVIVVFATLPGSGKDEDELSVRVQDDREVTVEDMMKSGDGKSEEQTGIIQERFRRLRMKWWKTMRKYGSCKGNFGQIGTQEIWMAIPKVLLPEHTHILLFRRLQNLQDRGMPYHLHVKSSQLIRMKKLSLRLHQRLLLQKNRLNLKDGGSFLHLQKETIPTTPLQPLFTGTRQLKLVLH